MPRSKTLLKLIFLGIGIVGMAVLTLPQIRSQTQNGERPRKSSKPLRIGDGLQVLYDFQSTKGSTVHDRSKAGRPIDLKIANTRGIRRFQGGLEVRANTTIRSDKAPSRLIDASRRSSEITIEAWIRPAKSNQSGPARIVTLSSNTSNRNFTLGHDGDRYDVRLRTSRTSGNGLPSLSSPRRSLTTKLTHVVYTRDRNGRAKIYLNGTQAAQRQVAGSISNWNKSYRLSLGNESTGDRPWLGTFYLVAIYDRDLSPKEVTQNFKAGVTAQTELVEHKPRPLTKLARAEQNRHFKNQIAPLLARHCLECHGWDSKRGDLDLSRRFAAFKGGKNGKAIIPGNASKSSVWTLVQANKMPRRRPPLSLNEKKLLRRWIDDGATWSVETIREADYAHKAQIGVNLVRRLTVNEYIETVRSCVGVDITKDARKLLPRDLRADGFTNTSYNLNVDLKHIEAYAKLAQIIVERMDVKKFVAKYTSRQSLAKDNMQGAIAGMGKWLLRGPLKKEEVAAFLRVGKAVAKEGGTFHEATGYVIEAMLQSPRFLYRIENQKAATIREMAAYGLASRLSYILWGGPPDEELFRAAGAGELSDRKKIERHVDRMLQDPRVISRSCEFVSQWLNLDRLDNLRPNPKRFPQWNSDIASDMRAETLAFFKDVAWRQKRPLSDLLNAQVTYATPRLAKLYGLKPTGKGLARYDVSRASSRGGLLTQGSLLTIGGDDASMVARGLFVLHDLLDDEVGDPPPCVDTTPVPTKEGLSQRSVSLVRLANANCRGCHAKFEPLAFGLEKFDGIGAYHDVDEHGNKLRDDGKILFPGAKKAIPYKSSKELMDLLAKSERVRHTIERKITQFALGRPLRKTDEPILTKIHQASQKSGGTYKSVIRAIVMSDLVLKTQTEKTK
ncbi:MAG: DUF1592 domain-containing protein [Gemmataceae bacterium]